MLDSMCSLHRRRSFGFISFRVFLLFLFDGALVSFMFSFGIIYHHPRSIRYYRFSLFSLAPPRHLCCNGARVFLYMPALYENSVCFIFCCHCFGPQKNTSFLLTKYKFLSLFLYSLFLSLSLSVALSRDFRYCFNAIQFMLCI